MNNHEKTLLFGILGGFILGLVISSLLFRGGMMTYGMRGNNQMMENIDRHFIEQMIPHHEGAIEMAQLALINAKHPEVIYLAQNIIRDQQKEITDMKDWYKTWFGIDVPATSQGGQMMGGAKHMNSMSGDIETLKNAQDFDVEFIRQMIPHHEMAVMMAEMLQSSTNRPEMKTLAENIIASQTREINQMRDWYNKWSK